MLIECHLRTVAAMPMAVLICFAVTVVGHAQSQTAEKKQSPKIVIVMNTITADKKQQCEDSVLKFMAALKTAGASDPVIKQSHEHTPCPLPG